MAFPVLSGASLAKIRVLTVLPPGSFLNAPAPTSAALRREVANDPILRARLRNTLHLPDDAAVVQMVAQLNPASLSEPKVLKIYYARKAGAWGYKIRRVPEGTHVFADRTGEAKLLQICGNPCESMSPARIIRPDRVANYSPNESDAGLVLEGFDEPMLPFDGDALVRPEVVLPDPAGAEQVMTVVGGQEEPMVAAGAILTPPSLAIPPLSSGLSNTPGLVSIGVGLLPITVQLSGRPKPASTTAVPEPRLPIFAGTACAALALAIRRGRRRRP